MKTNNLPPMLQRADPHPELLARAITNAQAPGQPVSFEHGQAFLQRAAAQLEVGDQSEEQRRDRVAAFYDKIIRDSYERSLAYDLPMSDEFRMDYDMQKMSPKKLAALEFRLSLRPTPLAVRYIAWLHDALGTDAPNPLSGWLEAMEADIKERYTHQNPHGIFRDAERQVFALVGLYASALLGWIDEFCAALPLDVMANACTTVGKRWSPELAARLAEQRQRLRVWAIVLNIIERDYLRESVLPSPMRSALDSEQLKFSSAIDGMAPQRAPASEAKAATAEARSRVKTLYANACANASMFHCHQQLLLLAAANLRYGHCRGDYMLNIDFLEQTSGSSDLGNGPSSDASASTKPEQADKQGA